MMAHKRKANNPNRLKNPGLDPREPFTRVPFEVWGDVRALDEDGGDDDEHADEGEGGCAGELVDVAVEGERVGDGDGAEGDDELAVSEEGEDRGGGEGGEGGADDLGDCVAYDYAECAHSYQININSLRKL